MAVSRMGLVVRPVEHMETMACIIASGASGEHDLLDISGCGSCVFIIASVCQCQNMAWGDLSSTGVDV
jgi:hypothetical protein